MALSKEKFPRWFLVFSEFLLTIYFMFKTDSSNSWPNNWQAQISHQRLRKSFTNNPKLKELVLSTMKRRPLLKIFDLLLVSN